MRLLASLVRSLWACMGWQTIERIIQERKFFLKDTCLDQFYKAQIFGEEKAYALHQMGWSLCRKKEAYQFVG